MTCRPTTLFCGVLIGILQRLADISTNRAHGLKAHTRFQLSLILLVFVSRLERCGDVHPHPGPDQTMEELMSGMEARLQINISETVRKLISEHSDRFLQGTKEQLAEVKEDISIITDNLQSISVDIDDLKSRVNLLEVRCDYNEHYRHGLQADLAETGDRLKDTMAELNEEIDRLEAYLRRENFLFFGIPMSVNEPVYRRCCKLSTQPCPGRT